VIQQLTQDHSLVMEQLRRGYITREQAEHSEIQNIILKALGSEESVDPDVEELVVVAGDVLVMCSDGLTKYVHDEEILRLTSASQSLEQACDALIQSAKERGGDDNITCLLLKFVERPWYKSIFHRWFSFTPSSVTSTSANSNMVGVGEYAKTAHDPNRKISAPSPAKTARVGDPWRPEWQSSF
jgi:serine/threonine protein phosphatase PrpC